MKNSASHIKKINIIIVTAMLIFIGLFISSCSSSNGMSTYGNSDTINNCAAYN